MVTSGMRQARATERAAGVYESRGVGNRYLLTTPQGEMLVDAGTLGDVRRGSEPFRKVSAGPLREHCQRGSRRIFRRISGPTEDILAAREVPPDIPIDERHVFLLGERHFEIIWTPVGETRSGVIVRLPDDGIAIIGNVFGPLSGNHPKLNTRTDPDHRPDPLLRAAAQELQQGVRRIGSLALPIGFARAIHPGVAIRLSP